jgi:AcrR family transcriptional regulator
MSAEEQQVPSVWTRPRRTGQPALSRERIVAEAIRLLDAEGVDALSMRTLGARLGAGATSLYRHVATKDELIELVVDAVYGEWEVPEVTRRAGWRAAAVETAYGLRATLLRHSWMASVLGQAGLAYLGPNLMRVSERVLAVFQNGGFSPEEADRAMNTLVAYVLGIATSETAYLAVLARTGKSEREYVDSLWPVAERAVQEHPRLREGYAAQRGKDPRQTREDAFDYGVQRVLDGLATRLG